MGSPPARQAYSTVAATGANTDTHMTRKNRRGTLLGSIHSDTNATSKAANTMPPMMSVSSAAKYECHSHAPNQRATWSKKISNKVKLRIVKT